MIYVVCNEKGGAGKSSLAQSLVVFLSSIRGASVALVDGDPQRTSADWAEERNEGGQFPKIPCYELHGAMVHELAELATNYDHVVVDCGGADSKAMRSALGIADVAILPFRPKRRDLKVAPSMADLIDEIVCVNQGLRVFSVVTQIPTLPSQAYRMQNAKAYLSELGLNPIDHMTRNLNAWDDAEECGASVLEYAEDQKAANDAIAVFEEVEGLCK